jgi:hypothetical protein
MPSACAARRGRGVVRKSLPGRQRSPFRVRRPWGKGDQRPPGPGTTVGPLLPIGGILGHLGGTAYHHPARHRGRTPVPRDQPRAVWEACGGWATVGMAAAAIRGSCRRGGYAGGVGAVLGQVTTPCGGRFPVLWQVGGDGLDEGTAPGHRDGALIACAQGGGGAIGAPRGAGREHHEVRVADRRCGRWREGSGAVPGPAARRWRGGAPSPARARRWDGPGLARGLQGGEEVVRGEGRPVCDVRGLTHGCHAAIWYSWVTPPRTCFRRTRCSARSI